MRKISFVISILLVSLLVGGYYAIAGIENPADPATVQTPWAGNVDAANFNLSNVGTLGVTTLTAGTVTVSNLVTSPLLVGGSASSTITGDGTLSTIGNALSIIANLIVGTTSTFNGDISFGSGVSVTQTATTVAVSTSSTSIDIGTSNKFHIALATSTTFIFTDPAGASNLTFKLTQDATGSRIVTWDGDVKWAGGSAPTLTTTGNAVDFVSCYFDTSLYFCTDSLDLK